MEQRRRLTPGVRSVLLRRTCKPSDNVITRQWNRNTERERTEEKNVFVCIGIIAAVVAASIVDSETALVEWK